MDAAHEWTDGQIDALTKRLDSLYARAVKEMTEKLAEHLKDYEEQKRAWQEDLRTGRRTYDEYDDWRRQQANRQTWISTMASDLAAEATHADKVALDYVNGEVPRIYAENVNRSFYGIETQIGFDTHSFSLYDQKTVALLAADPEATRLPEAVQDEAKDSVWNMRKVNEAMTQSILQGESVEDAAKRLAEVAAMDERCAVRTARTIFTAAENAGRVESYRVADAIGVRVEKRWMATPDMRTRLSHREMDGVHVPYDQPFVVGLSESRMMYPADPNGAAEECYNCFVGETDVQVDSRVIRSYRHLYVGMLVTIETASGVKFTCTPNHPILTPRGWVGANSLNLGDDVCIALGRGGMVRGNPDIDHVVTSMKTLHELVSLLADKRTRLLGMNFHGDIPTSNVEVVGEERLLRIDWHSLFGEGIAELALEDADTLVPCLGTLCESFGGVVGTTSGTLCRERVLLALLEGHTLHANTHSLGCSAALDTSIPQDAGDGASGMPDSLRDGQLGLTSEIGTDNVVSVEVSYTGGTHVYNLQTGNGYYYVTSKDSGNSIIAHNCRCTLTAWTPIIEGAKVERWSNLPHGVTYEDWKAGKKAQAEEEE